MSTKRTNLITVLIMIAFLLAILLALAPLSGCTKREEDNARKGGGTAATFLGLPPVVGESLVSLGLLVIGAIGGHKNGRRTERRCRIQKPMVTP